MEVRFSSHVLKRVKQSGHSLNKLNYIIMKLPLIEGNMRWRTSIGVLALERVNPNLVLVKTYVPRYKFYNKGYSYRKGCHVY